jgi:hypothetical protein
VSCGVDSPQLTNNLDRRYSVKSDVLGNAADGSQIAQGPIRLNAEDANLSHLRIEAVEELAISTNGDVEVCSSRGVCPIARLTKECELLSAFHGSCNRLKVRGRPTQGSSNDAFPAVSASRSHER